MSLYPGPIDQNFRVLNHDGNLLHIYKLVAGVARPARAGPGCREPSLSPRRVEQSLGHTASIPRASKLKTHHQSRPNLLQRFRRRPCRGKGDGRLRQSRLSSINFRINAIFAGYLLPCPRDLPHSRRF